MKKQGTRLPEGRRKLSGKRLLAAFVSLCMIVSLLPSTALAEEGIQDTVTAGETVSRDVSAPDSTAADTSGLCEHHIRHDESCGYTEETAEIPCSHQHTGNCGGLTDPAACSHTHDDTCGYVSAAAGTPCTYACESCQGTETDTSDPQVNTITEWNWVDEQKTLAEDGRLYLPSAVTAENLEEIAALLPQYIQAGEEKIALAWTYDEATGIFTAALPENYALAEGAGTLTVETVVMGADTLEEQTVTYIDANGIEQTVSATIITSEGVEPSTSGGWFAVLGNVTIDHRVSIQGNVKLILADGCSLTIDDGINVTGNNSLTIYGQSLGTGSLSATAKSGSGNAGIGGNSNQDGGSITANGSKGIPDPNGGSFPIGGGNAGIGGGINGNSGSITIYGGSVAATGDSADIG